MNLADALTAAAASLQASGIAESRREASSLLSFILSRPGSFLFAHPEYELTTEEQVRFDECVQRRAKREPFQYITGRQEFFGHEFEVGPGILIPRPETEILVEAAIDRLAGIELPKFLEIGVGSGCISISILYAVPTATAIGIDLSPIALETTGRNAEKHRVANRLILHKGDLFEGVSGKFDLIVSNPPYIPEAEIAALQPEVRDFEPYSALSGGADGLDIIRRIIATAPGFMAVGGTLLIEIGFGEAEAVRGLLAPPTWENCEFVPDLQGIPRILSAKLVS